MVEWGTFIWSISIAEVHLFGCVTLDRTALRLFKICRKRPSWPSSVVIWSRERMKLPKHRCSVWWEEVMASQIGCSWRLPLPPRFFGLVILKQESLSVCRCLEQMLHLKVWRILKMVSHVLPSVSRKFNERFISTTCIKNIPTNLQKPISPQCISRRKDQVNQLLDLLQQLEAKSVIFACDLNAVSVPRTATETGFFGVV